jgi:3alpha(or 20beta)-hydroxysteroid dehydrogenase
MTGILGGKVALITGAVGGIGSQAARLMAAAGATLVLADLDAVRGRSLADELRALFFAFDVSDEQAWQHAIDVIEERHGRLDILVNSAGIFEVASIAGTTIEMFERTMRVNQTSTFLGIRHAAPLMGRNGGGSIVNLSSAAGLTGTPGTIAYTTSKWAVRGMTKVAATELAPLGIRVNSVHPGGIDTDMTRFIKGDRSALPSPQPLPIARVGRPDEVAQMILFLASDLSSYSTGSEFVCDGGLTAR